MKSILIISITVPMIFLAIMLLKPQISFISTYDFISMEMWAAFPILGVFTYVMGIIVILVRNVYLKRKENKQ